MMKTALKYIAAPLAATIALVVAIGPTGCSSRHQKEVRMAYPPIVSSLPMFIAQEHGLLEKSGVALKKVEFESSNDMVNALVSGEVDVLPAVSLIPIIHLEIQYPGRARIFSHSRMRKENAFDSIIVPSASSIQALEDLEGKKVGAFPGTSAGNMFLAFLKKHGVDADSVKVVPLAPSAQMASLASGAIDALFSYEPITTTALLDPKYRQLHGSVYADLLDPCPIGSSAVSRRFERENPKDAEGAIAAIDEAVEFMRRTPDEAKSLLPQFTKMPSNVASRVNYVDVTLSSEVDVENLQAFIDLLHEIGEIPEAIDARRLIGPTE